MRKQDRVLFLRYCISLSFGFVDDALREFEADNDKKRCYGFYSFSPLLSPI